MYNLYLVYNLAVWLQQINKLYLLTLTHGLQLRCASKMRRYFSRESWTTRNV